MIEKNYMGLDGFVWWMGVVENRQDPMELGRCQVRFFGLHSDSLTDIPSADLPWAIPANSLNNHTFATPKETDVVFGFFADGNSRQLPIMIGIIPGYETNPAAIGTGYHDLRAQSTIAKAPKRPVARTYKTDGTGVKIGEANTADPKVLESLRYPRAEDLNKNTLTGLSRGVLYPNDVMQSRLNEQYPVVTTANKQSFIEPRPSFAPVYPYNQALATESGHSLEFDDTPGAERITLSHRSGTFTEYYPTGTKIEEVVKSNYKIVFADDFVHIMGHALVKVDSDVFIKANGNVYVEAGNDLNIAVSGTMNLSVKEALNIKAQSLNIDIAKDSTLVSGGDTYLTTDGKLNVDAIGDALITSETGQVGILSVTDAVSLTGLDVNVNSGDPAIPATPGKTAGLNVPDARSVKNDNPISTDGPTKFEVVAIVDDKNITKDAFDQVLASAGLPPTGTVPLAPSGNTATPNAGGKIVTASCGGIQLQDDYSQVKISDNFTLAAYTQGGSRKLQDQYGLSASDILCNIVKHSKNILEPLLAAGFKFTITSGFRRGAQDLGGAAAAARVVGGTYTTSDHDLGRATDLTNISKNGVSLSSYDAAVQMYQVVGAVAKQFLLEYESSGGGGWVHIAFADGAKSGLPFATFLDHHTYAANKFVNLKS